MKLPWPQRFLGYGPTSVDPVWAIWEPVSNRFILISHREDILATISRFTPRKFRSILIKLDQSIISNNLIDNNVCANWSLADSSHIPLSDHCWNAAESGQLIELGPYTNWDLGAEQDFFMAAHHLLEYLDQSVFLPKNIDEIYDEHWLPCYAVVNSVLQDPVLRQDQIELRVLLQTKAQQIIFSCHTLDELDRAWYDTLDQHKLVDHWGEKVQWWHITR